MATVNGMTSEKILELVSSAFISASIDENTGVLTFQTKGGQTVSAGNVDNQANIDQAVQNAIDKAHPIGSIFMTTVNISPKTQLGLGTWIAWGSGRVPVGVDGTQAEFSAAEQVGGEKKHTLSEAELPAHTHDSGALSIANAGDHKHTVSRGSVTGSSSNKAVQSNVDDTPDGLTGSAGDHTHSISGKTASTGATAGHNNLQPYITCYMWKRTA